MNENVRRRSIPALKVRQWLSDWNDIEWKPHENRAEPQHWFYQLSLPAAELRMLSGIYPRSTKGRARGSQDLGIQRGHESIRSQEIRKFVKYGYPWSNLTEAKRNSGQFEDLRQPGWLPTAIVVNVLTKEDKRPDGQVDPGDLVEIEDGENGVAKLMMPSLEAGWEPRGAHPIEVIDGQHRLWAFHGDGDPLDGNFELPVVAFVGLDRSWQAYLFYTINIKPKKINASLAYDLYPLLRTEQWLTKFEGHVVYRETRAQELVDLLWSHPQSPWHHRINMLGEKGSKGFMVTQASWIRSLLASFIKSWDGRGTSIGGLFGSAVNEHRTVLRWTRTEQAAFLILVGQVLKDKIFELEEPWMEALRDHRAPRTIPEDKDPAFFGTHNLLNNDQGVRALLQVVNDLCFVRADELRLYNWGGDGHDEGFDEENINHSLESLKKIERIRGYIRELAKGLACYDWRASSEPHLTDTERVFKAAFRGSGGYKELRRDVLRHLSYVTGPVAQVALDVTKRLGY